MRVKNLHSGSTGGKNWLKLWMEYKGYGDFVPFCSNTECFNKAEHGGHVKKVDSKDNKWYIVPLCAKCNETKDLEFDVLADDLVLVSDLSKTHSV
ncbi:MAG: hypothetical protein IJR35_03405 [Synergistaceae bacterium]|nr:hypothetical protein [Synergistaceae bacterium]